MFNSPLAYCPLCREYVALDCPQRACAALHRCTGATCPLAHYFIHAGRPGNGQGRGAPAPAPPAAPQ